MGMEVVVERRTRHQGRRGNASLPTPRSCAGHEQGIDLLGCIQAARIEAIDRPSKAPLGAGKAASTAVGAAMANAVRDATCLRLRTVLFTVERVRSTLR